MKIAVAANGPYLVTGGVPLVLETIVSDTEGGSESWKSGRAFEVKDVYALCRCGHSAHKPFCDGAHATVGFDGTETASREPYDKQAKAIDGPVLQLQDVDALCAFARFCDVAGTVWALVERSDAQSQTLAAREAGHCPSGRLVVRHTSTGEKVEPQLTQSIGLIEDPVEECSGPLWVRGGIPVEAADGTAYEVRNRVTLCRCGVSQNKPFCDGSHAEARFNDGLGER